MDGQFPDFKKSALQYLQCTTGLGNGSCAVSALGNMEDPVSQGCQLQEGCDLFFGYVQVCGKLFCDRHWAYIPEKTAREADSRAGLFTRRKRRVRLPCKERARETHSARPQSRSISLSLAEHPT